MDPERLNPEVLPPRRRGRPLAVGVAFAFLVAAGAANFMAGTRCERYHSCARGAHRYGPMGAFAVAPVPMAVRIDFETTPDGVEIRRLSGDALGCRTPCAVSIPRGGVEQFRLIWPDGVVTTTSAVTTHDSVLRITR